MCGIAGFVTSEASDRWAAVIEDITGTIRHRGPDGFGYFNDSLAHLGHRRLSIIDVAAGIQPMYNEDRRLAIVYNGEIFNHADLRPALEAAGHHYVTRCDTETVLHAYEEYGRSCVTRFRGMFAFAIWDRSRQKLFCARDRLGIKPFYYFWNGRLFAFASEIKALLRHPAISTEFDESQVSEYLAFGYGSGEETLFKGIRKLMPGHTLELDAREELPRLHIEQYWDVPEPPTGEARRGEQARDDQAWIDECRMRLEETVRMRLMSDVPLGMFLSGGLDSSAIAALMKRMTGSPVKTFAVGYAEREFSELDYARQVSEMIGSTHHEVVIGMDDFFGALPALIWHEDEPLAWPSSVSLYFVSRLAADHVKVVLTGEGSDELFAGYGRYNFYLKNLQAMKYYALLPKRARGGIRTAIAQSGLLSGNLRRKVMHTVLGRSEDIQSLYLENFYCAFSEAEQVRFGRARGNPYGHFMDRWEARPDAPLLHRLLYADQKTYLVELLMKQDQMSMATSIESRVPFLDHPFVEFAARVPDRLKLHNGSGKYILKQAVADLLPASIIHRKKMGFPTPLASWFRDPKAEPLFEAICAPDGLVAACLDRESVSALIQRHRSGFEDATDRIWRLLNFQMWGDLFITGKRERSGLESLAEPALPR